MPLSSFFIAIVVAPTAAAPPVEDTHERVGQIFIVGNTRTRQSIILHQVPLFSGALLDRKALVTAERNLARTGRFQVDPENGIRPTVTILESDGAFKDILVTVQERRMTSFSQAIYGFARPRFDAMPWFALVDWKYWILDSALDWLP